MSWLHSATDSPTPFEGVLGLRPELLALYRDFYGKLWDDALVPVALLDLCRLRIARLHNCEAEAVVRHAASGVSDTQIAALDDWGAADCFSSAARAALALADKMPWQPHAITDEDIAALRAHLSDPQVVALMLALTLFDMQCRLRLALGIEPQPATVSAPYSADAILH